MAEGKRGILVYADWIDKFDDLTDEEAGKLIKHFFRYVNDLDPKAPDRMTKLLFSDIKNTLKRDLLKYQETKEIRSYNGRLGNLKRYNLDLYNDVLNNKKTLKQAEVVAKARKESLSDSPLSPPIAKLADSVSDSVSDSVIHKYSVEDFLKNWEDCRAHYLKKPTNIKKLTPFESDSFERVKKEFTKEEINNSMQTLFQQERIPAQAMVLRPKHFLENIETYHSGENERKIYGSK